ncbi:type II secretion system protein XpsH [Arenimonas composti]|uniref:Type II secretion system protein H n=1 Tax=Arenimonas composti TR7-09 = DSM 18010 TaxID=1121013 RepID=A0A091BF44_9GAMM|nr:GspH/FimT family pseudopilin [Arenimonas composti]KFN51328.1 hypothetical protein P873_03410 [Arenimonas composti TR7-09 = DSM 18010]
MKRQRGFSLLEIVVVIALIAMLAGIAAATIGRAMPGQQLRGSARELATQLRFTRAQAIASGREQVFELDLGSRAWRGAGGRSGRVPEDFELIVTTARDPRPQREVAVVRFFPDGAATGGRIVLQYRDAAWRIDIGWLTGEVKLARGRGEP